MEERLSAAGGGLAAELRAGVATVTLNRPAALNALTLGMMEGLAAWLEAWQRDPRVRLILMKGAGDKAFCAGGDIRALHDNHKSGAALNQRFMAIEYALDYRIHTYPKPIVALIDGVVMGGGMGLSQGARLRIVGERTRMAMPETAIGLFPDVGGSYFLSRVPGKVGIYLGLAGPTLRAADAIYCGLADAYLAPDALGILDEALGRAAQSPDPAAAMRTAIPPSGMLRVGELERLRPAIDRHFAHGTVEAIIASLDSERGPEHREWARRTAASLERRSPTMLKVTLEQLRRGATMSLADCLRMELNLVHGCFEQGDFVEGVRALLVDKDNEPRWHPATLAAADRPSIQRFFEPRWPAHQHPLAHL